MPRAYRAPSGEPAEPEQATSLGHQTGRVYNTPAAKEETGAPDPATPVVEEDGTEPFDPAEHNVEVVNHYLATGSIDLEAEGEPVDQDELDRVFAAESEGQARKGVLEGPHAKTDEA